MVGFEASWLTARRPYDEAALDQGAIAKIQAWAGALPEAQALTVVDLGSGTGVAIRRATAWLAPRTLRAYAVDDDPTLLAQLGLEISIQDEGHGRPPTKVTPLVGDVLAPLDRLGGPVDGSVDLVLGHALADLLPLGRLAARVAALLRPGGLAHLALTYDGLTAFEPGVGPSFPDLDLDRRVIEAFHRRMDHHRVAEPGYGGSTAGRRLAAALEAAGLEIVADAASVWQVRAGDGPGGQAVLSRLIQYVVEAVDDEGRVLASDLGAWEATCRVALGAGSLEARVGHRDVLAQRPDSARRPGRG
jgi:SAM-dependent methyltransferase